MNVENEIQLISRVFCYSWLVFFFIGFLVEKCTPCQSRKSDFGWHRFRFSPCLMRNRVEKSQAFRNCISNGKPEQLLYLTFVCLFVFTNFMMSSVVYAASLCTFVRFEKMI